MARKKKHAEHENHERWLVSYADFITLLFAFFTSMYAISSVNAGKFRVLSESLAIAFNPSAGSSSKFNVGPELVKEARSHAAGQAKEDIFANSYKRIDDSLKTLEKNQKLSLFYDEKKIIIRVSDGVLFDPGSDEITKDGQQVLDEIASVLKDIPNYISIEGNTDNIPINTLRFPSNWDLSNARALQILKYFIKEHKFDPRKISATGYGEYRPIDSNDTPSGRKKNRRVDISILRNAE